MCVCCARDCVPDQFTVLKLLLNNGRIVGEQMRAARMQKRPACAAPAWHGPCRGHRYERPHVIRARPSPPGRSPYCDDWAMPCCWSVSRRRGWKHRIVHEHLLGEHVHLVENVECVAAAKGRLHDAVKRAHGGGLSGVQATRGR